jgi:hypothetical protein
MGGKITDWSIPRVEGKLAISRFVILFFFFLFFLLFSLYFSLSFLSFFTLFSLFSLFLFIFFPLTSTNYSYNSSHLSYRALGDFDLAEKGVIWNPNIRLIPNYKEEHRYLLMASDGLWDYVCFIRIFICVCVNRILLIHSHTFTDERRRCDKNRKRNFRV